MDNLEPLTRRMDAVEAAVKKGREDSSRENAGILAAVRDVSDRLGHPTDGEDKPATGLYWRMETMAKKLSPFERRWEQTKAAMTTVGLMLPPTGALIWFLAGDKLTKLLHG